ncbi:hypothetical protein [Sporisorium scitamineum]|uniref:Uncharacterized protein n=1 Tax=Sporisorium scitamineum TaxID=49012 RepID=A0A0F7S5Y2_9BASI|nr:hypothetical protein [Sporisorium scitamineum]
MAAWLKQTSGLINTRPSSLTGTICSNWQLPMPRLSSASMRAYAWSNTQQEPARDPWFSIEFVWPLDRASVRRSAIIRPEPSYYADRRIAEGESSRADILSLGSIQREYDIAAGFAG